MPTTARDVKKEIVHIRASAAEKAALAEAARLRGKKLSQFVLAAALDAARQVQAEERTILMSPEGYEAFARRLDEAPREIPALKAQYRKLAGKAVFCIQHGTESTSSNR